MFAAPGFPSMVRLKPSLDGGSARVNCQSARVRGQPSQGLPGGSLSRPVDGNRWTVAGRLNDTVEGVRHMRSLRTRTGRALIWVSISLAITGCRVASPAAPGGSSLDRPHLWAEAALARWAASTGGAAPAVVFVGDLTSQIGDWEASVGDNDKVALMSGAVRPAASLPTASPAPGEVRWPDGTSATVELLSAGDALAGITRSGDAGCAGCRPLEITGARLTTGSVQTSRGPATAPIWAFTVAGSSVVITRVAAADAVAVDPPPWDPNDAPQGISIDSARGDAGSRDLTVSFIGAPAAGDQPCGADYAAEAVESELAVVVIVTEHPNPVPAACSLVGALRTAAVHLASPLGNRVVLELKEGRPVPLLAP